MTRLPDSMMRLSELTALLQGATLFGADCSFNQVSTDTRSVADHALFFALRGERFDAHDFADQAIEQGAVALVVEKKLPIDVPQIIVQDTRAALGAAAAGWRSRFKIPIISVTGSNGKTTVTQMLAAILLEEAGEDGRLATRGNLNNEIGLPLTLFRLRESHRYAVLELGMNHPGEIAILAQRAKAQIAVVNNAQREHQEFMGSVEATAHENGASITALPHNGVAVFPADDPCAPIWRQLAGQRTIMDFGFHHPAAVKAAFKRMPEGLELRLETPKGRLTCEVHLAGEHNAHNAAAAATAAIALGVPLEAIQKGLRNFQPVSGRGVMRTSILGATIIDDSYNANPDSVRAAIDLLANQNGRAILILGDMGEVGKMGAEFHREIGAYASERRLSALLGHGDLCRHAIDAFEGAYGLHFDTIDALIDAAKDLAVPGATLLIKGSRFMRMERVVRALCEH